MADAYRVAAIWWPEGWEPVGPLDVPRCIAAAGGAETGPELSYAQAVTTAGGLNRQCMDAAAATWYVVTVVRHGPAATSELEVVRPEGGTRGDCSHCPAQSLPCAAQA